MFEGYRRPDLGQPQVVRNQQAASTRSQVLITAEGYQRPDLMTAQVVLPQASAVSVPPPQVSAQVTTFVSDQ
jgi:hypothetical protein